MTNFKPVMLMYNVERLCREPHEIPGRVKVTNEQGEPISSLRFRRSVSDTSELQGHQATERAAAFNGPHLSAIPETPLSRTQQKTGAAAAAMRSKTDPSLAVSDKQGTGLTVGRLTTNTRRSNLKKSLTSALSTPPDRVSFTESFDYLKLSITSNSSSSIEESPDSHSLAEEYSESIAAQAEFETLQQPSPVHKVPPVERKEEKLTAGVADEGSGHLGYFRPLLLFIPLRLGQDCFNMEYAEALKVNESLCVCVCVWCMLC